MISFTQHGDFSKLTGFLEKAAEGIGLGRLNKYGRAGVKALSSVTPKDTGKTASSWSYKIKNSNNVASISFYNSNQNDGVPIAIILQYGHATGNGGWVQGIDYINPAIKPLFEELAEEAWKEMTSG